MLAELARQVIIPTPSGSNPLWLEKRERRQMMSRLLSLAVLIVLLSAAYLLVQDYRSAKDPNASECSMGFAKTGCMQGYKCIGERVPCTETGEKFRYAATGIIFPEKKCKAPEIYKEYCVPDAKAQ